jgi:hypothetical protein
MIARKHVLVRDVRECYKIKQNKTSSLDKRSYVNTVVHIEYMYLSNIYGEIFISTFMRIGHRVILE